MVQVILISISILSTIIWIGVEINSFIKETYNPLFFFRSNSNIYDTILNLLQIVPLLFLKPIHSSLVYMALLALIVGMTTAILNLKSFMKTKNRRIIIETLIMDLVVVFVFISVFKSVQ